MSLQSVKESPVIAAAATVGGLLFFYLLKKNSEQDRKIDQLTLELLTASKSDIQTLRGASDRKDWLKANSEYQTWADGLL